MIDHSHSELIRYNATGIDKIKFKTLYEVEEEEEKVEEIDDHDYTPISSESFNIWINEMNLKKLAMNKNP